MREISPLLTRALFVGVFSWAGLVASAAETPAAPVAAPAASGNATAAPAPRVNLATLPVPREGAWLQMHLSFVDLAKKGGIDVLFVGDSITDYWRRPGPRYGQAVWEKNFGNLKAANFGIAADCTEHVLWRLKNGEGQGFSPKVIVLMIGTNNINGFYSPAQVIEGVTAVVQELRQDFPAAKILFLGIFPRGFSAAEPSRATITAINRELARLHDGQHVFYLDIGQKFLAPDGALSAGIMPDQLHPSEKGYEIWAAAIQEPLAKLLNSPAPAPPVSK